MADDITVPGTGEVLAYDEIAGRKHALDKVMWGPDGTANYADVASGKPLPVQLRGSDGTDYSIPAKGSTITTSVTRPADTTAYAANDAWSDSTSAPAAITFSNVFHTSGGSSILLSAVITSSANKATALQGELWLFNTAPTVINDNAAFTVTDAEYETLVAKLPFVLDSPGNSAADASGNTGCVITGINEMLTGVSSANLTGLIKVLNAYTPVSAEKLTFRLQVLQVN